MEFISIFFCYIVSGTIRGIYIRNFRYDLCLTVESSCIEVEPIKFAKSGNRPEKRCSFGVLSFFLRISKIALLEKMMLRKHVQLKNLFDLSCIRLIRYLVRFYFLNPATAFIKGCFYPHPVYAKVISCAKGVTSIYNLAIRIRSNYLEQNSFNLKLTQN